MVAGTEGRLKDVFEPEEARIFPLIRCFKSAKKVSCRHNRILYYIRIIYTKFLVIEFSVLITIPFMAVIAKGVGWFERESSSNLDEREERY